MPDQQFQRSRTLIASVGCGVLFTCIITLPLFLMTRDDRSGLESGFKFLFYIGPALIAYMIAAMVLCHKLGLRAWRLAPVISVGAYFLFFVIDHPHISNVQPRLIVIVVATLIVAAITIFPIEFGATKGRFATALLLFLVLAGAITGASIGIGNYYMSKQTNKLIRSYDVIDFPVYYFARGLDPAKVGARLGKSPFTKTSTIDFYSSAFERFGESKYTGTPPSADCGTAYGQNPSQPTIWECAPIHTTDNYVLYREKLTYSNSAAVTPYDYYYFAIFANKTVVWYGGSELLLSATDTPLNEVKAFFNSLEQVNLQSAEMVRVLGNQAI